MKKNKTSKLYKLQLIEKLKKLHREFPIKTIITKKKKLSKAQESIATI